MSNIIPNPIITLADIKNNPELWIQKVSVILFTDQQGKPYWTKDYNFLPNYERYNQAVKWIRETNFLEYNCRIVANQDNSINIITQNNFGIDISLAQKEQELLGKIRKKLHQQINELEKEDLTKKDLEELLKLKTHEGLKNSPYNYLYQQELEELKQTSVKKNKSKTKPINYDFSRPDLVILWRKQLYFITNFTYINNWKLTVEIRAKKCPLFLYYWNWMKVQGIGTIDKAPIIQDTEQRMHYDFCGDLGIKRVYQQSFTSYQPSFALFKSRSEGIKNVNWFTKNNFEAPMDVRLSRVWGRNIQLDSDITSLLSSFTPRKIISGRVFTDLVRKLSSQKVFLTVGPTELPERESLWYHFSKKEEVLFTEDKNLAEKFKNQPHLWDHTTFQFYLFNKITMSANGRFLGIRYDKVKDQFILPYKIFINFSPGNVYYRWEFGPISVKCEISTEAIFQDYDNPLRYITGVKMEAATFGGGLNWNPEAAEKKGENHIGEQGMAEQEANTERTFKSTYRNFLDKSIEPVMFNANTIDYHYSLGEFFNRLTDPIFFLRIEHSELLNNRLNWANNKNKVLNLPVQWNTLAKFAQKEGYWRWREVYLESDNNNFFSHLMTKGYWLTDGQELTNPDFKFARSSNYIALGSNAWDITIAEEEVIEKVEHHEGKDNSGGDTVIPESTAVYIRKTSQVKNEETGDNYLTEAIESLPSDAFKRNEDGSNWYFWHNKNYTNTIDIPSGSYTQQIIGYNSSGNSDTGQKGDKLTVKLIGTNLTVKVHGDFITREVKITERKTQTQEIDQKELETREEEMEDSFEEELDINEVEQENGEGGVGEREREKEEEKENEHEKEEEQEEETEQENEQEDEKENEGEKEDDKEDEEESENEGEDEGEGEGEGEN